ncbi:hypothetical protein DK389_20030 [Methylobacterium durans]|uniref:Uncharacterized protein n=1 Tax=Methylobacterium durans TaxID=2202825 RepID=A0A2U8WAM4_9HYPH|nr:hypothetical protein DK389_20030 [Methylobacterium durans]
MRGRGHHAASAGRARPTEDHRHATRPPSRPRRRPARRPPRSADRRGPVLRRRLRPAAAPPSLPGGAPLRSRPARGPVGYNCDAVQQGLSGPQPYSCPLPGPRPLGARCFCDMPIASFSTPQTAVGRVAP